jgi:hypothetical protein
MRIYRLIAITAFVIALIAGIPTSASAGGSSGGSAKFVDLHVKASPLGYVGTERPPNVLCSKHASVHTNVYGSVVQSSSGELSGITEEDDGAFYGNATAFVSMKAYQLGSVVIVKVTFADLTNMYWGSFLYSIPRYGYAAGCALSSRAHPNVLIYVVPSGAALSGIWFGGHSLLLGNPPPLG